LAAKIDEYSHQIRFSRSKFLAQAVTEAITKIEMGYDLSDFDVRNMTDSQKLAIALNTLNEPTPEQEISSAVLANLKRSIKEYEQRLQQAKRDAAFASTMTQESVDPQPDISFIRTRRSANVTAVDLNTEQPLAEIVKLDYKVKPYTIVDSSTGEQTGRFRLLREAKEEVLRIYG
jgi:hypothetical protein